MNYNPQMHHRRSIRLKGYDYSQEGAYFITICTQDRECFFGRIANDEMVLNDIGKIAHDYLRDIPNHFSHVALGEFIVMPNHVHCILIVGMRNDTSGNTDTTDAVGTRHGVSDKMITPDNMRTRHGVSQQLNINQFGKPVAGSISVIINQYKSSVKRWCNKNGHENYKWQSRFHDHIIRNEQSYQTIANYIVNNPLKWMEDKLHE